VLAIRRLDRRTRRLVVVAGMASYLDAGALVASGLAIGGFYAEGLDLVPAAIGSLLGLQTLAFAVGALVGGRLGDRWGRRRVLVASLLVYGVGVAVLFAAGGTTSLAVGVVLSGLAIGGDLPTSLALVAEEAPLGAKATAVALTQLLWVGGIAATGLLGLLLADLGVLAGRLLYLHLLVVALVVLLLRLRLGESGEWAAERGRAGARDPRRGTPWAARRAAARPMAWPVPLVLTAYYTAWNIGANTLGQLKPYLWIDVMGGTPRGASLLILAPIPLGLVLSAVFLLVVDGPARSRWMVAGALVSTAGWLLVAVWPTPEAFVVLIVSFVIGASVSGEVAFKIWAQELVPTLLRATVQGSALAVARVAAAAVAAVTPAVATSDPQALFAGLLVASVGATVACWWLAARAPAIGVLSPSSSAAPPAPG
jgi:inositol transporter-like SP family MFS transporter